MCIYVCIYMCVCVYIYIYIYIMSSQQSPASRWGWDKRGFHRSVRSATGVHRFMHTIPVPYSSNLRFFFIIL